MKTINDDPYEFFQQGGWTFLGGAAAGSDAVSSFSVFIHIRINNASVYRAATMVRRQNQSSKHSQRIWLALRAKMKKVNSMALMLATIQAVNLRLMMIQKVLELSYLASCIEMLIICFRRRLG